MSRLRTLLVFAALAGAGRPCFAACGGSGSGSSDESPQTVLEGRDPRRDRKRRPRPLGRRSRSAATKAATSTSASPARSRAKAGTAARTRHDREANGSVNGEDVDFEGGIVLRPEQGLRQLRRRRVRSRPDDLQLRRVGDRRSAAARRRGKRDRGRHRMPGRSGRQVQRRRLRRQPDERRLAPTSAAPKRPRSAATSTSAAPLEAVIEADRNPGLQLAARSRRAAAARANSKRPRAKSKRR